MPFLLASNNTSLQKLHPDHSVSFQGLKQRGNSWGFSVAKGVLASCDSESSGNVAQLHQATKSGFLRFPNTRCNVLSNHLHFYHAFPGSWWQISQGLSRQAHMARRSHVGDIRCSRLLSLHLFALKNKALGSFPSSLKRQERRPVVARDCIISLTL